MNKWTVLISNLRKEEFMNRYSIWDISDEYSDSNTVTKVND